MNAAKTSMSSKILGPESDFFAEMAVDAVTAVKTESDGDQGKKVVKYPVSAVHILKCHGLSLLDSRMEHGYALNCVRASQGMPTSVKGAKIACLDINLQRYKMQMGVQVNALSFCLDFLRL